MFITDELGIRKLLRDTPNSFARARSMPQKLDSIMPLGILDDDLRALASERGRDEVAESFRDTFELTLFDNE